MSHNLHVFRHRARHLLGAVGIAAVLLLVPPFAQGIWSARGRTAEASPLPSLGRAAHGDVVARLAAPHVGLDVPVLEGADADTLARGAGRLPSSNLPGESRGLKHCVILVATESLATSVSRLEKGDEIEMKTPFGVRRLRVVERRVVSPREFSIEPAARPRVTLVAPRYAQDGIGPAPERLLVSAELIS